MGCSGEWYDTISDKKRTSTYRKDQSIVFEGAPVLGMYFILNGKVKIISTGINNKTQIVRLAKSGGIVGHRGYGNEKYPIGAIALEKSEICFLPNNLLQDLFIENPLFTYNLMMYYSKELRISEAKIQHLAQMNVTEKVVDALMYLKKCFGIIEDSGVRIDADLNRKDIADLAGVNTEQLSRVLSELKKEGTILTHHRSIRINHINKLREHISPFQQF